MAATLAILIGTYLRAGGDMTAKVVTVLPAVRGFTQAAERERASPSRAAPRGARPLLRSPCAYTDRPVTQRPANHSDEHVRNRRTGTCSGPWCHPARCRRCRGATSRTR